MSGGALPGLGLASYNGIVFDGPMVSSKVSIEPVRDATDRTVMYQNITVELHVTINTDYCGDAQEDVGLVVLRQLEEIRYALSQDGKALKFEDKVFTKFHVNTEASDIDRQIDVNFGPRVKLTSIAPIVSNRAFEVVWSVTAAVGGCPELFEGSPIGTASRSWQMGDVKQIAYNVGWSGDSRGYQTRTISGFVEIVIAPELESIPGTLSFTADDYRENVTIKLAENFRRVTNDWVLNERRDRINFTVRDEEMQTPNAFPPNVVDIEINHSVEVGIASGFCQATSTLSGHCEVANPYTAALAWERLFPVINERITAARSDAPILLMNIRVSEMMYSRRIDFSITYQKLGTSPAGFLKSSAMFTPTTNTWAAWRATMYGTPVFGELPGLPFSRRGVSNQAYVVNDTVITPCTPQQVYVTVESTSPTAEPSVIASAMANVVPNAQDSYRKYRNTITSVVRPGAAAFSEMPSAYSSYTPSVARTAGGVQIGPGLNSGSFYGASSDSTSVAPMVEFVLEGEAQRVGYPVELPTLTDAWSGVVQKIPDGSMIKATSINLLGVDVYFSKWSIRYKIAESLFDAAADLGDLTQTLFSTTTHPYGDQAIIR